MQYPYYVIDLLEEYNKADKTERENLRARIIANIGDEAVVAQLLPPDDEDADSAGKSSADPISSFLEKFADKRPVGYMRELELHEEKEGTDSGVIPQSEENEETLEPAYVEKEDNWEVQFANLVKNKNFRDALEIIERQNLINPQKNIYFADQMRFLRKLIEIENFKNKPGS